MRYNPNIHHRRSIRLKAYDYSQTGLYFVTICTRNREHLFGEIRDGKMVLNAYGRIVDDEWRYLKTKYPHIELHPYVIMPNHFHGIIKICDVSAVGAGFARPDNDNTARPDDAINPDNNTAIHPNNDYDIHPNNDYDTRPNNHSWQCQPGRVNPAPTATLGNMIGYFKYHTTKKINLPIKIWQRNYHEHIIRTNRSHQYIVNYITTNPENWDNDTLNTAL